MIKQEYINIKSNGVSSNHEFYSNTESNNLVLFFPGGNSNTSGPIFYYLRDYFLRNGYDVLSFSYKELLKDEQSYKQKIATIANSVHKSIQMIEKKKTYEKKVFVSKSFGNVVSNAARDKYDIEIDKYIYISPLPETISSIEKYPGFVITSNHDEYINQEVMDKILSLRDHETLVFKDGDHSLECEDTNKTLDFCKSFIFKVIKFVNNEPLNSKRSCGSEDLEVQLRMKALIDDGTEVYFSKSFSSIVAPVTGDYVIDSMFAVKQKVVGVTHDFRDNKCIVELIEKEISKDRLEHIRGVAHLHNWIEE